MTHHADRWHEQRCDDCGDTVTVVDDPVHHRADDPHWAEAYTEQSENFQHCWKCGRVLWSPLEIGA